MEIYFGSKNKSKIREYASLFLGTSHVLKPVDTNIDIEETATTFDDCALQKAIGYSKIVNGFVFAEDSGICVDSISGLPGVRSARFCDYSVDRKNDGTYYLSNKVIMHSGVNRKKKDEKNNIKLLDLMKHLTKKEDRMATLWVSFFVVDKKQDAIFKTTAWEHGFISEESKGDFGFGYDSIFIGSNSFGKTYAEIDCCRKNLRSPRKKIMRDFKSWLHSTSN